MTMMRLVVITGLSGSGKSTAVRALEDDAFFVVDNLPMTLLPALLKILSEDQPTYTDVAVVLDVRNRAFLAAGETVMKDINASGYSPEVIFLDADDHVIQRRFSETRRLHPVSSAEGVAEGIRQERDSLSFLRECAKSILDTSNLTPHQLRSLVVSTVRGNQTGNNLSVQLQSFGFRYGVPAESDLVMDVRFLPNPHFVPELQPLTGREEAVANFVLEQSISQQFLTHFRQLLDFLIPQYRQEGKNYLTISVGCTGGRHRSVAIIEALSGLLPVDGTVISTVHRDVDRGTG
jgi:UPF0042 nucleotide-binding protein